MDTLENVNAALKLRLPLLPSCPTFDTNLVEISLVN